MKNLITFVSLLLLLACISCSSKSGRLAEQRELAAVEAKLDSELDTKLQMEIERGYDEIIIMHADISYKPLNDSVVVRTEDNAFFHKRPAPRGMKNTSAFRYYRVF